MITDLALPKPRAPSYLAAAFAVFCQARKFARFKPEHPDGAGAQQFAARGTFAGVTVAAWNYQHDDSPPGQ